MRGPDRVQRKLRPAPVRDGTIPSRMMPRPEARRLYRARALKDGRCVACGAVRDSEATRTYCRPCAVKHARRERLRKKCKNPVDEASQRAYAPVVAIGATENWRTP